MLLAARARAGFRRRAATATGIVGAAVLAFSLLQVLYLLPLAAEMLEGEARDRALEGRPIGFFITPGVLAGYFAVSSVFAWGGANVRTASPILAGALLLTRSLSGPVALAAGIAAGWGRKAGPAIAAAAILAGAVVLWRSPGSLRPSRWPDLVPAQTRAWIGGRVWIWEGAYRAWTLSPAAFAIGHGPGSYGDAVTPVRHPLADRTRRAHNWPLETAVEGGLVGLILWCAAVGGALAAARDAPPHIRAAAWALVTHSSVEVSAHDPGLRILFMAILGMCLAPKSRREENLPPQG